MFIDGKDKNILELYLLADGFLISAHNSNMVISSS